MGGEINPMNKINKAILSLALLGGGTLASAQVSVGIHLGPPPPPRVLHVRPRMPGSGYAWVDGYWYPSGNKYKWRKGYWMRPPYAGARWVAPRYDRNYIQGYWEGDRGRRDYRGRDYHDRNDRDRRHHDRD